MFRAVNTV